MRTSLSSRLVRVKESSVSKKVLLTYLYAVLVGAIRPLTNHGIPTMSMGFLLPRSEGPAGNQDTPIVWRGLMVQKAVQQLLFDVDWTYGESGPGLDVLVIDMPPGTGDVPLTLGQLVNVDGLFFLLKPKPFYADNWMIVRLCHRLYPTRRVSCRR